MFSLITDSIIGHDIKSIACFHFSWLRKTLGNLSIIRSHAHGTAASSTAWKKHQTDNYNVTD